MMMGLIDCLAAGGLDENPSPATNRLAKTKGNFISLVRLFDVQLIVNDEK